jgi:signal peptidase II
VTKAERTIGTPGFEPAAGEPADGQHSDGRRPDGDRPAPPAAGEPAADAVPPAGAADGPDPVDPGADPDGEPGTGGDAGAAPGRGKRRMPALLGVAALAYLLDIVSKTLVVHHLEGRPAIPVLGSYLQLWATRNSGAAFGIGQGMTIVFSVIALIVIGVIARLSRKLYSVPWAIALGLLLGGALGNLTDRIFRSPGVFRGAVVDFIAPKDFAVFNLADSAIVCGGVLIVWLSFRGLDPDGTLHRD